MCRSRWRPRRRPVGDLVLSVALLPGPVVENGSVVTDRAGGNANREVRQVSGARRAGAATQRLWPRQADSELAIRLAPLPDRGRSRSPLDHARPPSPIGGDWLQEDCCSARSGSVDSLVNILDAEVQDHAPRRLGRNHRIGAEHEPAPLADIDFGEALLVYRKRQAEGVLEERRGSMNIPNDQIHLVEFHTSPPKAPPARTSAVRRIPDDIAVVPATCQRGPGRSLDASGKADP